MASPDGGAMIASKQQLAVRMTVSTRPHYLERTLESWAQVRGLVNISFGFHVEPTAELEQNLEIIARFQKHSGATGPVVVNDTRLGVLVNPWHAFEEGFLDGHGFVVLTDEDVVVSTDIIEFYQWGARAFRAMSKVFGICAGQLARDLPDSAALGTRLLADFVPISFGLWLDRWAEVFRNSWDFTYSTGPGGGREAGWDWNVKRIMHREEAKFLFPDEARADHIGEFGVHMLPVGFASSQAPSFVLERPPGEYVLPYGRGGGPIRWLGT